LSKDYLFEIIFKKLEHFKIQHNQMEKHNFMSITIILVSFP